MKNLFKNIPVLIISILVVYIFINIVHFTWLIVNPEGFWGFVYYLEIFGITIFIIILVIFIIIFSILGIFHLFSDFPDNFSIKNILKGISFLIILLIIMAFNFITENGISFYIEKKLANKYRDLKKSERYFDNNDYKTALDFAKKSYEKIIATKKSNAFFILSKLYEQSDYYNKQFLTSKYSTVINYAYCLQANENLDSAKTIYFQALKLAEEPVLKNDKTYYAFPLAYLAELSIDQGKFEDGESYYNQLIQFVSNYKKEDMEYVCIANEIIAGYSDRVGNIQKAAFIRNKNIKDYEDKGLNLKSIAYFAYLMTATSSNIKTGDINTAGRLLYKAKPMAENWKDEDFYLSFLSVKANYCNIAALNNNGYEKVVEESFWSKVFSFFSSQLTLQERFLCEYERCLKELVSESKKRHGENSPSYASSIKMLAGYYVCHYRQNEADDLYKKAMKIITPLKNSNTELYYSTLLSYLISKTINKKNDEIDIQKINEFENYYFNRLASNFLLFSESERESYIAKVEKEINAVNSLLLFSKLPEFSSHIYNNLLATKNIALYSNQYNREIFLSSNDTIKNEYSTLQKEKEKLEYLKNSPSSNVDFGKEQNELEIKEKIILNKIINIPNYKPFNPCSIRWTDVKSQLKEGEVAIEYFTVPDLLFSESLLNYFALLVTNKSDSPEIIPLFKEKQLYSVLNKKGSTQIRIDSIYGNNYKELYDLIWKPIEKFLIGKKKVYISPTATLYRISFTTFFIGKTYDIEMVGSTRNILDNNRMTGNQKSIALFGDIDYNLKANSSVKNISDTLKERNTVKILEYSKPEIDSIKKIINNTTKYKVGVYSGSDATEETFRRVISNKVDIIHISTHGFYLSSNENSSLNQNFSNEINPMSKCELLFAGANNKNTYTPSNNDGYISALEISRLDLSKTELVVLSACETGLGNIQGSEGVQGFVRAFTLAGVKYKIVSLWNVSDSKTSELMALFYKNYINSTDVSLAMKQAQLEMRNKYPQSPYYWAGFIVIKN